MTGCRTARALIAAGRLRDRTLDDHLAGCDACREHLEALAEDAGGAGETGRFPDVEPPPGFAEAVLARTSGAACPRAESSLPSWIDGELATGEAELVGRHVERCRGCARLAAILERAGVELPGLAEVPAPPELLAGVLAATSGAACRPERRPERLPERRPTRLPVRRAARWPVRRAARWRAAWRRLLLRPRAGLELAYAATALAAVAGGIVGSPAASLSEGATAVARANPTRTLSRPAAQVPEWLAGGLGTVHRTAVVEMPRASRRAAVSALARARDDIGTILDRFASEEERDGTTHGTRPARPSRGDTP